jgi:hypothetical protein
MPERACASITDPKTKSRLVSCSATTVFTVVKRMLYSPTIGVIYGCPASVPQPAIRCARD